MKKLLLLAVMLPTFMFAMKFEEAQFLLQRTGFTSTYDEISILEPMKREDAVRYLLKQSTNKAQNPYPSWYGTSLMEGRKYSNLSAKEKKVLRKLRRKRGRELQSWWLNEMITTNSPMTEKMTLFWHNHFTSELQKVKWPTLMLNQNILLREESLGNFANLLHAIAKDPAMILYLDNQSNKKSHPNENFARELLELFTLGEGHYSETDIKEAARAFTGWSVNKKNGKFRFNPRVHDYGKKTFLGQTGFFDGDDIIDIILREDQTAKFITAKFYKEFISPVVDKSEIERIAAIFKKSGYEIKTLLYEILTSNKISSKTDVDLLIKSPIELVVGTVRAFAVETDAIGYLFRSTKMMGQELLNPPNVKGWTGGKDWITTGSLAERRSFLTVAGRLLDRKYQNSDQFTIQELSKWLLVTDPVTQITDQRRRFSSTLLDPTYIVK
jgi:uncharacterized protein (DUF1800 family)